MIKMNNKVSLQQVKSQLRLVRDELYPKDLELLISSGKCLTKDDIESKKQIFLQERIQLPYMNDAGNNKKKNQEIVIFGSKYMMSLLAKNSIWLMDGTFKVSPRNYCQLLTIIIYDKALSLYIPGAYILLTSKESELYNTAFMNLKLIISSYVKNFQDPEKLIVDFETGLRKSLKTCFPKSVIDGCFFHFCKALWTNASKLGLKKSELDTTKNLICIMKCLVHIKLDEREELWKGICDIYKSKGENYKKFLKYFQYNWLNNYFINFAENSTEEMKLRSNNACESFNSKLNRAIRIKHPNIGILINTLLDFELKYRQNHLEKIDSGSQQLGNSLSKEQFLPFTFIFNFIKARQPTFCLYKLRSITNEEDFWNDVMRAAQECYNYLFKNKDLEDLDSSDEWHLSSKFIYEKKNKIIRYKSRRDDY